MMNQLCLCLTCRQKNVWSCYSVILSGKETNGSWTYALNIYVNFFKSNVTKKDKFHLYHFLHRNKLYVPIYKFIIFFFKVYIT